jgi:hypothetical protein
MGETKRRKQAGTFLHDRAHLQSGLEAIHAEGAGVYELPFFNRAGIAELWAAALAGNEKARAYLHVLEQTQRHITAPTVPDTERGMLCLLCDTVFWRGCQPEAFIVLHAHRDIPTQVVLQCICPRCYTAHGSLPDLKGAVLAKLRRDVISDLREIPPPSAPGHA